MEFSEGERVDRYTLLERLGAGGQGAVYRALDPLDPQRPRALKLVSVAEARPSDLERVRREARALATLEHSALVKCHGLFEDLTHGVLGISMDFVAGVSLRVAGQDPRWTQQHVAWALRHIAEALAYLHEQGLVHRDIKLDNVVVADAFFAAPQVSGNVKLVDFGIAVFPNISQPLTAVGSVIGTLSYLAPEQIDPTHFPANASSPAIDIFAYGVLGWQLFSGAHPSGLVQTAGLVDYAGVYRRVAGSAEPWPPQVFDASWTEVLRGCLSVSQNSRVPHGRALLERIAQLGLGSPLGVAASPALYAPASAVAGSQPYSQLQAQQSAQPRPQHYLQSGVLSPAVTADPNFATAPTHFDVNQRAASGAEALKSLHAQALVSAPAPAKRGTSLWVSLGLGLIVLSCAGAAGVWYLREVRGAEPAPQVLNRAPKPKKSAPPLEEEKAVSPLPQGCSAEAPLCDCCPSGRSCGELGCEEGLEVAGWWIRVGRVEMSREATASDTGLIRKPDAKLCVKSARLSRRCAPLLAGAGDEGRIYLDTMDLKERLELSVQVDSYSPVPVALGTHLPSSSAKLSRAVLCTGFEVQMREGLVAKLGLFLDPAVKTGAAAEQCEIAIVGPAAPAASPSAKAEEPVGPEPVLVPELEPSATTAERDSDDKDRSKSDLRRLP